MKGVSARSLAKATLAVQSAAKKIVNSQKKNKKKTSRGKSRGRSANKNVLRLKGKDLVTFLPDEVVSSTNSLFSVITANPCYWKGTRIAQVAAAYQAYHINSISFEYVPQVSVGYNGSVIAGTLWDGAPADQSLQQSLVTSPGGKIKVCYRGFTTTPSLAGLQQRRYNTNGELGQSTNPFTFMACIRGGQLAYQNPSTTQVVPGYFWVHYDYSFYNPIGSGWLYGVQYDTTINDMVPVVTNNISLVNLESFGTFGSASIFDYDNGQVRFRGTEIDVPTGIHFNVYYNGTMISQSHQVTAIKTKLDPIVAVQVSRDATSDNPTWENLQPYRADATNILPAGGGHAVTIRLLRNMQAGIIDNNFPTLLQAWWGHTDFEITQASLSPVYYYFKYPMELIDTIYVRVKTDLGRHSTPLVISFALWDITNALDGQVPATLALNYRLDIDNEPWQDDDGQPVTPIPIDQFDDEILNGIDYLPIPSGPKLADLEVDRITNLMEESDMLEMKAGDAVNENNLLAWVLNTPIAEHLINIPFYTFRPQTVSTITSPVYGDYKLVQLMEDIDPLANNTWYYAQDVNPVPINYVGYPWTTSPITGGVPFLALIQTGLNSWSTVTFLSGDFENKWAFTINAKRIATLQKMSGNGFYTETTPWTWGTGADVKALAVDPSNPYITIVGNSGLGAVVVQPTAYNMQFSFKNE